MGLGIDAILVVLGRIVNISVPDGQVKVSRKIMQDSKDATLMNHILGNHSLVELI